MHGGSLSVHVDSSMRSRWMTPITPCICQPVAVSRKRKSRKEQADCGVCKHCKVPDVCTLR
jgi:hypothetical protein